MGRPHRIDPEAGIHHVYTRGTKRWAIFLDDHDRRRFLGTLDRTCSRHDVSVLAYCLMDNHVHLVLQFGEAGVSAAMRDLKSRYARWFNDRHRSSGPIFEDRFGSTLVTSFMQLRELVRYVHRNPYAMDATMALSRYQWSSHPAYVGDAPAPAWLKPELALSLFDGYRKVVETPRSNDAVQNVPPGSAPSVLVPGTRTLERPSLSAIRLAVARAAGCEPIEVHPSRRNGLIGLAVLLAAELGQYSHSEMVEPYGYRSVSAAERAGSRARQRIIERVELAAIHRKAEDALWPTAA